MKNKYKNEMKTILLIGILLVMGVNLVSAKNIQASIIVQGLEPVQNVEFYDDYPVYSTVFTNYSVMLYDLRVYDFGSSESINGSFKAQLLDENKEIISEQNFEPSFMILSDPPTETDADIIDLNFPYSKEAKYLRVYWNKNQMLLDEISGLLCNNNGKCDGSENIFSCSDCKPFGEDGICQGYSGDHYCDKDCYDDDDCHTANCNDKIKNQNETGIDAGGICAQGNCYDGIKNGDEERVDCSGRCEPCPKVECGTFKLNIPKKAIASSENVNFWTGAGAAKKSIDNNKQTAWMSKIEKDKWIYFDLGQVTCISDAEIYLMKSMLVGMKIEVSDDAKNWSYVDRWNVKGENNFLTKHFNETIAARYIKLTQLSQNTPQFMITEFRVKSSPILSSGITGAVIGTSEADWRIIAVVSGILLVVIILVMFLQSRKKKRI
jgi:hypothetical protein